MSLKTIPLFLLALLLHMASPLTLKAAELDGALVLAVTPAVTSTLNGASSTLAVKMTIPVTAVLVSNAAGWAQLMFPDSSTISISPDTELELAEFVNTSAEQSVVMNLAAGTARVITGDVARRNPNAIIVNTPQASVGVRGTIACIKASPEKTVVYLTETSGAGITVTDRVTGSTVSMTTAGNVVEVQPGGSMKERPATPAEARANTVAARGPSAESATAAATAQDTPAKESSSAVTTVAQAAEAPAQGSSTTQKSDTSAQAPSSNAQAPGTSQPTPSVPTPNPTPNPTPPVPTPPVPTPPVPTPPVPTPPVPTPPVPTPPVPTPPVPTPPSVDVSQLRGYFSASGAAWAAGFKVLGTQISGASLTLNGNGFAINGSGTVNTDATFAIGSFASLDANDWGKLTAMNGQFGSQNSGSLTITNAPAGLNDTANFGAGMNINAISGRFGSTLLTVPAVNNAFFFLTAGFTVTGSNITDATVFSNDPTRYFYAGGTGTITNDGHFTITNFLDKVANLEPLTLTGQFNSLTSASLNIKTPSGGWNFNTNIASLNVSDICGVFEATSISQSVSYVAAFQVDGNAISNAALYKSGFPLSEKGSGTIKPDASFDINNFINPTGSSFAGGESTSMSGYFASLNGGRLFIKNPHDSHKLDISTSFFGFNPANIQGTFRGTMTNPQNGTVLFDVANSAISNANVTVTNVGSATAGSGIINLDGTFNVRNFTTDTLGNTVLHGEFLSLKDGVFGYTSTSSNSLGAQSFRQQ